MFVRWKKKVIILMVQNIYRNVKQYLDQVVNYIFDLLAPIRMIMWATGGIIYTLYEFSLALVFRIPAILISMIEGVDPKFYGRCTNSRNFIIMEFLYKWITFFIFPLRLIMNIPMKIFFGLLENLYLVPCPVIYAEQFIDPITHRNATDCEYDSLLDNVHIIPTPSEVITPIKNTCYYATNPIEFIKEFCAHLCYLS